MEVLEQYLTTIEHHHHDQHALHNDGDLDAMLLSQVHESNIQYFLCIEEGLSGDSSYQ